MYVCVCVCVYVCMWCVSLAKRLLGHCPETDPSKANEQANKQAGVTYVCVCVCACVLFVWQSERVGRTWSIPWTTCSLLNDRLGGQYWDCHRCVQVLFVCSYSDKDVAGQRGNAIWKLYWSASGSNRVFDERISEPRPRQFQAWWHFEFLAGRREVEMWSSSIDPTLLRRTMPMNKTKICAIASVNSVKWNMPLWDLVCFICQQIFWSLGFLLRSDSMPFYFCFS